MHAINKEDGFHGEISSKSDAYAALEDGAQLEDEPDTTRGTDDLEDDSGNPLLSRADDRDDPDDADAAQELADELADEGYEVVDRRGTMASPHECGACGAAALEEPGKRFELEDGTVLELEHGDVWCDECGAITDSNGEVHQ